MVKFDNSKYTFDTPDGPKTLLDLFDGRDQLVVYQFMDNGPDASARAARTSPTTSPAWATWPTPA